MGRHVLSRSRERGKRGGAEQGGGLQVEIDGGVGMSAQDGRGRHGTDGAIETGFDGSRFGAGPGTTARISVALRTWRTDMETSLPGNRVEILEPAFGDLLGAGRRGRGATMM